MQKLATKYNFEVNLTHSGVSITLIRLADKRVRNFVIAGHTLPQSVLSHMNSLTDTLCDELMKKA